jgi:hypothetical protein
MRSGGIGNDFVLPSMLACLKTTRQSLLHSKGAESSAGTERARDAGGSTHGGPLSRRWIRAPTGVLRSLLRRKPLDTLAVPVRSLPRQHVCNHVAQWHSGLHADGKQGHSADLALHEKCRRLPMGRLDRSGRALTLAVRAPEALRQ